MELGLLYESEAPQPWGQREYLEKFMKYEEASMDQVLCYVNFGHLRHEIVLQSTPLLGDHVIPEMKKAGTIRIAQSLENSITAQSAT